MLGGKVWAARAVEVVSSEPGCICLWYPAGSDFAVPTGYTEDRVLFHQNRWQIAREGWRLDVRRWERNHVLIVKDPSQYYSVQLFWDASTDQFLGYYINFELPYKMSTVGYDSLDLDLDLMVYPNGKYQWKDVDEYRAAVECGGITPEWAAHLDAAKQAVLTKIEQKQALVSFDVAEQYQRMHSTPVTFPVQWQTALQAY
ncbi:hypothetical protein MED297_04137 [Reinekea sp. MED297]|uniref:DUF402 domain-containing protein n=2 Tax=Reinekea TaxID=230494 RepID=A4BG32_9GAMM|nr:hypothetical protein MED297_04137 [Reinekea sp. MED297] [Reinekea blandensis MED297]